MRGKRVPQYLDEIAERDVPEVDLWPAIHARLPAADARLIQPNWSVHPLLTRRRTLIALGSLGLVLVPALAAAAPATPDTISKFARQFGLTLINQAVPPLPPLNVPNGSAQAVKKETAETSGPLNLVATGAYSGTPTPVAPVAVRVLPPPTLTLAQARAQAGFPVKGPTWLHNGITFQSAAAPKAARLVALVAVPNDGGLPENHRSPAPPAGAAPLATHGAATSPAQATPTPGPASLIVLSYARAHEQAGTLDIFELQGAGGQGGLVPSSAAQAAAVSGRPAIYARGGWRKPDPQRPADGLHWDGNFDESELSWDDGGVTYIIRSYELGLTESELIHIAESLR